MAFDPTKDMARELNPVGTNLRYLCAEKPSTAAVCRDLGINQQQFSKYLSGKAKPSPHNLRRIAHYFGVEEVHILGPLDVMKSAYEQQAAGRSRKIEDPLVAGFPGNLERLRQYLGAYQVFFKAPITPDGVVANAIFLDERNGEVYSRLIEALPEGRSQRRRWTRCDGKVSYQNGRIYVVDRERSQERALSLQILAQPPRQRDRFLFGTMCFLASLPNRTPHASKVVWRRFESYRSIRTLFESCGVYSQNSRKLDPKVRHHLAPATDAAIWP